jgi:hypothetical protein
MIRAAEKPCAAATHSQFAIRDGVLRQFAPTATNSASDSLPRVFAAFGQVRAEEFAARGVAA